MFVFSYKNIYKYIQYIYIYIIYTILAVFIFKFLFIARVFFIPGNNHRFTESNILKYIPISCFLQTTTNTSKYYMLECRICAHFSRFVLSWRNRSQSFKNIKTKMSIWQEILLQNKLFTKFWSTIFVYNFVLRFFSIWQNFEILNILLIFSRFSRILAIILVSDLLTCVFANIRKIYYYL